MTDKHKPNPDDDGEQPADDRPIWQRPISRRGALGALTAAGTFGLLGGARALDGTLENVEGDDLWAAGVPNLSQQYRRETYVTAPDSAFDPTVLDAGEVFWVGDTGELGIWDGSAKGYPPIGNGDQPLDGSALTVGAADQVTGGPVGDVDEWVVLANARYHTGAVSTTSTSFTNLLAGATKVPTPVPPLANIKQYAVGFSCQLRNDTVGEDFTVRLQNHTTATVTVTGDAWTPSTSSRADIASPSGSPNTIQDDVEGKVTGGTGTLESITIVVWGQIQ